MKTKHKLDYCAHCKSYIIRCATCNNNCCNAGYGQLPNGSTCPDCPDAYKVQEAFYNDITSVTFESIPVLGMIKLESIKEDAEKEYDKANKAFRNKSRKK